MFNYLYKLTAKKLLNAVLVYVSYFISLTVKRPVVWAMPLSLSVEPASYCNLHCAECPLGSKEYKRAKALIDIDLYTKIIDETHSYLLNLFLYFQGEPLLNPQIAALVAYANKRNIYTALSTNANFVSPTLIRQLVESGLDKLIVSLDGLDNETYTQYRKGGDVQKVLNFLHQIKQIKNELKSKTPEIEIQFLVLKTNQHQIHTLKKNYQKMGADTLRFKSAQISHTQNFELFLTDIKKYARYSFKNEKYTIKNRLKNRCFRIWNSAVIDVQGNVLPCCFDKDGLFACGNTVNQSFRCIWKGKKFHQFRHTILHHRPRIEMCTNCTEGLRK